MLRPRPVRHRGHTRPTSPPHICFTPGRTCLVPQRCRKQMPEDASQSLCYFSHYVDKTPEGSNLRVGGLLMSSSWLEGASQQGRFSRRSLRLSLLHLSGRQEPDNSRDSLEPPSSFLWPCIYLPARCHVQRVPRFPQTAAPAENTRSSELVASHIQAITKPPKVPANQQGKWGKG